MIRLTLNIVTECYPIVRTFSDIYVVVVILQKLVLPHSFQCVLYSPLCACLHSCNPLLSNECKYKH